MREECKGFWLVPGSSEKPGKEHDPECALSGTGATHLKEKSVRLSPSVKGSVHSQGTLEFSSGFPKSVRNFQKAKPVPWHVPALAATSQAAFNASPKCTGKKLESWSSFPKHTSWRIVVISLLEFLHSFIEFNESCGLSPPKHLHPKCRIVILDSLKIQLIVGSYSVNPDASTTRERGL